MADLPEDQTYSIFGAGNSGQTLFALINSYRSDLTIEFFIDSYKSGMINDINIISPVEFFKQKHTHCILIASEFWYEIERELNANNHTNYLKIPLRFLYRKTIKEIQKQENVINPVDNHFFPLCFNGQENSSILEKLKQVENLLSFPDEKTLYRLITCQNLSQDECRAAIINYYFSNKPATQYMEFINPQWVKNMMDGGVYNGRETIFFVEGFQSLLNIYGFEPNEEVLLTSDYYERINQVNFHHIKKGLWFKEATLYFKIDGSSSHITQQKTGDELLKIEVTSIDKYVEECGIATIDFIKMDIEGAELEALKGAYHTIKKNRPQLAICIYHKPSDFYEIPLYLDSVLENYNYHLNHYAPSPYESVWYAIPNEKATTSSLI